jgi:hypothetical protein
LKIFNLITKKSKTFPSPLTGEGKGGGEIFLHGGGRNLLCSLPINSKGISVIFLVIAMMLMVTIGYVFSYLIPTKQKSVSFVTQSPQAFFIAQSGVEYAVRYAVAHNWRTTADLAPLNGVNRNLGAGRFTINYTNIAPNLDTLTSWGEVPNSTERRRITVTNFTSFMQQHLVLDTTYDPCLHYTRAGGNYTYELYFHMIDIDPAGLSTIRLNSFRASWDVDPPAINRIRLSNTDTSGSTTVFNGTPVYNNGDPIVPFDTSHTIQPTQEHLVRIRWDATPGIRDFSNLIVYFYDINGNEYTFALDPDGIGLIGQTAACP